MGIQKLTYFNGFWIKKLSKSNYNSTQLKQLALRLDTLATWNPPQHHAPPPPPPQQTFQALLDQLEPKFGTDSH